MHGLSDDILIERILFMDIENLPENLKAISESIESLITVEIRKKGHHGPGIVKKLWQSVIDHLY